MPELIGNHPARHPLNTITAPSHLLDETHFASCRRILMLAGPLVLSQMGVMIMQIVDGVFLAHYSESALAAIGPSGMSFWLICGLFTGMVGYTSTFVAQHVGARQPARVGAVLWQGIYLALAAGLCLAATALAAGPLFHWTGHAPAIRDLEIVYFRVLCWGGVSFMLSSAVSGFYAGRHDNMPLMLAHLAGGVANAVFDALLIFGLLGFPELGMAGAAWATVIGHTLQAGILGVMLFKAPFRQAFGTWRSRALCPALMLRLIRYGFPNGVRFVIEIAAWTVFLMILGRVDSEGLAASNIAWRINGMAFFPVIGLSIAVSMLVGQAQGAGRPDLSRRATHRGLLIGQVWMASMAALMVLFPDTLLRLFFSSAPTAQELAIHALSVKLLRFVAAYCLVDNFNIVFMAMLAGAGDTRWMLIVSGVLHAGFIAALLLLAWLGAGTMLLWLAATAFVFVVAGAWILRFRSGAWEGKRVVDTPPPDIITPAFSGPNASEA